LANGFEATSKKCPQILAGRACVDENSWNERTRPLEDDMTIDFVPEQQAETKPRITVFGVGGAGGNAVNNMINGQLEGVDFVVANTDSQSLVQSLCEHRVQLGVNITHGLGAGARPDIGKVAAEEAIDDIQRYLDGNNMVFIAAGMGGGTGTGGAPVIARAAREQGILTVGVITKPFQFEGIQRMRLAELGIQELQQYVDTLIVIPNQNLFRIANDHTTFADAFKMADDVLHAGVRGVTDLMVNPGLINLDFADIRTVMSEMGKAMMGTGEAEGDSRAIQAAEAAINNPLLDNASIEGARGVLINITGGTDLTLHEVDEAASRICTEVDSNANIIFGTSLDHDLEGQMRVAVIATGIDAGEMRAPVPEPSDKVHVLGFSDRKSAGAGSGASAPTAEIRSEDAGELVLGTAAGTAELAPGDSFDTLPTTGTGESEAVAKETSDASEVEAPIEPRAQPAPVAEAIPTIAQQQPAPAPAPAPIAQPAPAARPAAQRQPAPIPAPAATPAPAPQPRVEHKTVAASTSGAVAARVAVPDPKPRVEQPTAPRVPGGIGLSAQRGDHSIDRMARGAGVPQRESVGESRFGGGMPGEQHDPGRTTRKPTLFERMTGTGRARREPEEGELLLTETQAAPRATAPMAPRAPSVPVGVAPRRDIAQTLPPKVEPSAEIAPKTPQQPAPAPAIENAPLDTLGSPQGAPSGEEDPLDIPAFLRRQAN
jgi:cell division protein FtsZ